MKSRTSFFNKTVFLKNLTRFAPAWGLYTVGLLLALVSLIDGGSRWFAGNLCDFVQMLCIITPCYALLCAQLLFGDLYNSRMCNALHALPMKRETWFGTNVLSGFLFHLIPTVIFAILAGIAALFCYPGDWQAAAMWLLGVNLQFACFFGIAVLSAFCVGNRFAQAVIYGILNFGSLILGWLVDTVFVPLYYGIKINMAPFFWFSPVGQMTQEPFCTQTRSYVSNGQLDPGELLLGENFVYYFIVAAVGIGLLFLALHLYRRRNLEYAGDFLAIKGLEPVFLVVYTVIMGTVFHFISDDIFGMETWLFLFLGLPVGWFTGKMLLERTPRVFRLKNCLHCGLVMANCLLILVAAWLDPFGIETWMPDGSEVESVTIADGHYNYHNGVATLDDPEEIQKIIDIHRETLHDYKHRISHETTFEDAYEELILKQDREQMDYDMQFTITYQLKNGRTVSRYYNIWMGDETGPYLKKLFSRPEVVFECDDVNAFLESNRSLIIRDYWEGKETLSNAHTDIAGLVNAILADCEAGTMAQHGGFHNGDHSLYGINFGNGLEVIIFTDCENTLNWLRNYGLDVDGMIEKRNEFG